MKAVGRRPEILREYRAGEKVLYIALKYGCSTSTVRVIAKQAGDPPRPSGAKGGRRRVQLDSRAP